ncbi:Alpha/Beta hydrolase protein [Tuber brumale]|nr:Alpha/Beta hydrolase protein [Tuber brumale]
MQSPTPISDPTLLQIPLDTQTINISGLPINIYGLSSHPPSTPLTCVHLLHPRNQAHEYMSGIARSLLLPSPASPNSPHSQALICAAFDSRNHGARVTSPLANGSWKEGNATHAEDLFSLYHGTVEDLRMVVEYLGVYLRRPLRHFAVGVSLGGHAAYLALALPRVEGIVSVIGCPDYRRLIGGRAEKSGVDVREVFEDAGLGEIVGRLDPAAIGVEGLKGVWKGKRLLALSGGADRLVPYACSEPFLAEVKRAVGRGELELDVKDIVYEGVKHECTSEMVRELVRWFAACLKDMDGGLKGSSVL